MPASRGDTIRYRLNRGRDRSLNKAVHIISITRMTHDSDLKASVEKMLAEGRTRREIRLRLKLYEARYLYRTFNAQHATYATT